VVSVRKSECSFPEEETETLERSVQFLKLVVRRVAVFHLESADLDMSSPGSGFNHYFSGSPVTPHGQFLFYFFIQEVLK
jgi:hypothetical protein